MLFGCAPKNLGFITPNLLQRARESLWVPRQNYRGCCGPKIPIRAFASVNHRPQAIGEILELRNGHHGDLLFG